MLRLCCWWSGHYGSLSPGTCCGCAVGVLYFQQYSKSLCMFCLVVVLLMEEILHQLIGSLKFIPWFTGLFSHPRWCRMVFYAVIMVSLLLSWRFLPFLQLRVPGFTVTRPNLWGILIHYLKTWFVVDATARGSKLGADQWREIVLNWRQVRCPLSIFEWEGLEISSFFWLWCWQWWISYMFFAYFSLEVSHDQWFGSVQVSFWGFLTWTSKGFHLWQW